MNFIRLCTTPILSSVLALSSGAAMGHELEHSRFVVYYADQAEPAAFEPYSLVVLDSATHPDLVPLRASGKILLGYLSLGEIAVYRPDYAVAEAAGVLLDRNPRWPDSSLVDLRRPEWTRLLTHRRIPAILASGFDGLFLDTLDNAAYLEQRDPSRFAGMTAAAIALVREIRRLYPDTLLMMNRAFELLPVLETEIDLVLGESVLTDYDFETKRYSRVDDETYRAAVELLLAAKRRRPTLGILTLDYWDPKDRRGVEDIYRAQRANGFAPYVATIALDEIVREPGR